MFMMKNLWGQKFKLLESFVVKNNFLKFNLVTAPTWECIGIYLCKLSNELCGLWGESFHNILTQTWRVLLFKFRNEAMMEAWHEWKIRPKKGKILKKGPEDWWKDLQSDKHIVMGITYQSIT